jgi:hypothetical protein
MRWKGGEGGEGGREGEGGRGGEEVMVLGTANSLTISSDVRHQLFLILVFLVLYIIRF